VALPHLINRPALPAPHAQQNAEPTVLLATYAQQAADSQAAILTNRVREILWHIPWYGFKTQARLAQDSGVSPAAISRLIRGESQPSLVVALHVTQALSRRLGRHLDVSEVFSLDGTYPTPSVCHLTGCGNCLPPVAYDEAEELRPFYAGSY
jgi:DNA-binding XRE family transcriptional regulator